MENINIHASKLIHREEFVGEPVNLICKEINKMGEYNKKIILTGGRGIGKSTIMNQLQNRSIDTEQPFIYMKFANGGLSIHEDEQFTREFFEHYWEERFASQLLYYLKSYYEYTYYNNFREYSTFLEESTQKTIDYINNSIFDNSDALDRLLKSKEVTEEILDKLKEILRIENLGLCIDRFDWINNSDALTQQILSEYFPLFQKVILTSDDENLHDKKLPYRVYDSISYGKNVTIIQLIFLKRIQTLNQSLSEISSSLRFPTDWMTTDVLYMLANETNGNLSQMLEILNQLFHSWNFNKEITEKLIEREVNESKENIRGLRRISNPPKFHLK